MIDRDYLRFGRSALEQVGLPAVLARRQELANGLREARGNFAEAERLAGELAAMQPLRHSRVRAAAAMHAPTGIALAMAELVDLFLERDVGSEGRASESFTSLAETTMDTLISHWAPGFDDDRLTNQLLDPNALQALLVRPPPGVPASASDGYGPLQPPDIAQLAAHRIAPYLPSLLDNAQREGAEWKAAHAGSQTPTLGLSQFRASHAAGVSEAKERYEAMCAVESIYAAVLAAADDFPPLRLRSALKGLLVPIPASAPFSQGEIDPQSGRFSVKPSRFPRLVMGRALCGVLRSMEAVFPGLMALVKAPQGPRQLRGFSPFRVVSGGRAPGDADDDDALTRKLEEASALAVLDQAVMHARALFSIRSNDEPPLRHGRAFEVLRGLDAQSTDGAQTRREWHSRALLALGGQADSLFFQSASRMREFDLMAHTYEVFRRAALVTPTLSNELSALAQKPLVLGKGELLTALSALESAVTRQTGLWGTKLRLAEELAGEFRHPSQPSKLARAIAGGGLQVQNPQAFVTLLDRYRDACARVESEHVAAEAAGREITFWDNVNFLTNSPAELRHSSARAAMYAAIREAQGLFLELYGELDRITAAFPLAHLYFRISDVRVAAEAISSRKVENLDWKTSRHRPYIAELVGHREFVVMLEAWALQAQKVVGFPGNPSLLMERAIVNELQRASEPAQLLSTFGGT